MKVHTSGKGSTRTGESLQCCCIQRVNPPCFRVLQVVDILICPDIVGFSLAFEYDTRYVSSQNLTGVSFIQTSSSRIKKHYLLQEQRFKDCPSEFHHHNVLQQFSDGFPFQFAQGFFPRVFPTPRCGQASKTLPNSQSHTVS